MKHCNCDSKDKITITVIGTTDTHWETSLKVGQTACLEKEPDNSYDSEAIAVVYQGKKVGYVANSTRTVIQGTMSGGRLYDKIDDCSRIRIKFKTHEGKAIAEVIGC